MKLKTTFLGKDLGTAIDGQGVSIMQGKGKIQTELASGTQKEIDTFYTLITVLE